MEQPNTLHCVRPFAYSQTQPTNYTLFSNIVVGKNLSTHTILGAVRDCRANPLTALCSMTLALLQVIQLIV